MNIYELVCELLEEDVVKEDNTVEFTERAKNLIHEISEKCKEAPIVKETQKQAKKYAKGLTAEAVYVDMLHKILQAPSILHMVAAVQMLIPIIDDKLMSKESEEMPGDKL